MLPFMDRKRLAGSILSVRGNRALEVKSEVEAPNSEVDAGLKTAAEDLLQAIQDKSVLGICSALQAAYEICESMPEQEGPEMKEEA